METIHTRYLGELRTEATHLQSGTVILTDAPTDNQGKGEAFSPTDLLVASLGSCLMTIMGIAGRTHSIDLEGTQLKITKIMATQPRRVTEVKITVEFPTSRSFTSKERSMLEHAARTCPVALSLHPDLVQSIEFIYP